MLFCFEFIRNHDGYPDSSFVSHSIDIYNITCESCEKMINERIEAYGSYLYVEREHYYFHHYNMNCEKGNVKNELNYPDYTGKVKLCGECDNCLIIHERFTFEHGPKKETVNPFHGGNEKYYINESRKKMLDRVYKLYKLCDFRLTRYEYSD